MYMCLNSYDHGFHTVALYIRYYLMYDNSIYFVYFCEF